MQFELEVIQNMLPFWMQATHVPGAAVSLVAEDGRVEYACAGIQDVDSRTAISAQTVFEAASLSKPVFACCALMLAAEDLLHLEDPMPELMPDALIPDEPGLAALTPRLVLSHSSGLPNWFREDKPRALLFQPGEQFGYSGEAYCALQSGIDRVTGMDLEALAHQRIFKPLGMERSSYYRPAVFSAETTLGHDRDGNALPIPTLGAPCAGSSLHTSLADYTCFLQRFLNGDGWMSPIWRDRMLAPHTRIDERTAWGLGWGLKQIGKDWLFWQWGDNNGYKHLAAGSITQGRAICVLTNGERGYEIWKNVLHETFDPQDEIFNWLSRL